MSLTIDGNANSITSSTAGVNIPATVDTLSVGPSGSYMRVTSSGIAATTITATNITTTQVLNSSGRPILNSTGSILQVVQTVKTDTFSMTGGTFTDVTGLSVTITPSSTSSKILIMAQGIGGYQNYIIRFRLLRGSTPLALGDANGVRTQGTLSLSSYAGSTANDVYHLLPFTMTNLDSPSSTSATTYKIQIATYLSNAAYINRSHSWQNAIEYDGTMSSSIAAIEVSA